MSDTFNEKPTYRSSPATGPTVYRSVTSTRHADPAGLIDPFKNASLKDSDVGLSSVDLNVGPPVIPYALELCSPNTYRSDSSIGPAKLSRNYEALLVQAQIDVEKNGEWELHCVFYPDAEETSFDVHFFLDNSHTSSSKNASLIEMQLMGGNRCAFQKLCKFVRIKLDLQSAFCGTAWGSFYSAPQIEQASKETEFVYQPSRPMPLPKPGNLTRSTSSEAVNVFGAQDETNGCASYVDILFNYLLSPFADVQHTGWQELARATTELRMQTAVCKTICNGTDIVRFAAAVLATSECSMSVCKDTVRCVLQTLVRVYQSASQEQKNRIEGLQKEILRLAQTGPSREIRSLAVDLVQKLLPSSGSKTTLIQTLQTCSAGECRVSAKARGILSSLKVVKC